MSEGKSAATPQGFVAKRETTFQQHQKRIEQLLAEGMYDKGWKPEAFNRYNEIEMQECELGSVAAPKTQPEVNGRRFSWTPATDRMHAHVLYGDGDWAAVVYDNLALEVYADELAKRIADLLNEAGAPKAGEPPQNEISTLECCRRQLENILYCCNQEPPILVDSIRAYAETALKRVTREVGAGETPAERWIPVAEKIADFVHDYAELAGCSIGRPSPQVIARMILEASVPPGAGSTKENV